MVVSIIKKNISQRGPILSSAGEQMSGCVSIMYLSSVDPVRGEDKTKMGAPGAGGCTRCGSRVSWSANVAHSTLSGVSAVDIAAPFYTDERPRDILYNTSSVTAMQEVTVQTAREWRCASVLQSQC